MEYPDGAPIRVGDLVWWNEGRNIGFVQSIVESMEECEQWGLAGPHIFFADRHPFDPAVTGIAYPVSSLADEGVSQLTPQDLTSVAQAVKQARFQLGGIPQRLDYSVSAEWENSRLTRWVITFHGESEEETVVRIPVALLN